MEKIISCINSYLKDLEKEVLKLIEDKTMPMTTKNQKMEPLVDQKKILTKTLKELEELKNKEYKAECKMYLKG